MNRRDLLAGVMVGGAVWSSSPPSRAQQGAAPRELSGFGFPGQVVIERALQGRPHAGKVLAAIQPHADDLPLFAAGTVAKLVSEGYSGCLIRISNDEKCGDGTLGWPEEAPFDAIVVTAGAPAVPRDLEAQLREEGRLVIPIGTRCEQELYRFTRQGAECVMDWITLKRFW